MKYRVTIQFERTQSIEVEANSTDEACDLVNEGEFEDSQIANVEDDYVNIIGVEVSIPTLGAIHDSPNVPAN